MKAIQALAASAAVFALAGTAVAQDASKGQAMATMELPQACRTSEAPAVPGMADMQAMMENMGEAQKGFMQGMMDTQGPMLQAMMAEDPDVVFACAMIPHHQAAISMAEVELQQGDAAPMKEMAQKIIDAQKKEIEELTKWIEEQGR